MKTIKDYLPLKARKKTTTVQAQVDAELVKDVKKIMGKHRLRWGDVLTACLQKVKEDMGA